MAGIDWVELSRAVPYAGVAIIFGLFQIAILRLVGQQRKDERTAQDAKDERQEERRAERNKERDKAFTEAIERLSQGWRDFLAQQQETRTLQWAGVLAELRQLTAVVTLSADLLRAHDAWERGMLGALQLRRTSDAAYTTPKAGEQGDVHGTDA